MSDTILLTGSRGFTGKYVRKHLESKGYKVVGLVESNAEKDEIMGNLTDKKKLYDVVRKIRPHGVIHLAAISFVGHKNESEFYLVNTIGTTNLLEALVNTGCDLQKVILASSANIYGNPISPVATEKTIPAPVNHYAMSKLAMEIMVKNYYSMLPIIITRPFNYTGVGQSSNFLVPKIVEHFREEKKEIELGNLDVARDFSDVRDIARAYTMLFESEAVSDVVNLSSGKTYQLKEIVSMMQDISGNTINIKVNPDFVRKNEIKTLIGSCNKLKSLVDYAPEYKLYDTLNNMYSE